MDSNEKCFNCKHLIYRKGYEYPFTCAKHKWVSSKHSEVQYCLEEKCKKFEREEVQEVQDAADL